MVKVFHWTRPNEFKGEVTKENFVLVEEELSEDLKDGEVLCEAVYLSVAPYMRIHGGVIGNRKTMFGGVCSKVIKSCNDKFPVGTLVKSNSGWRTHFISENGKDLEKIPFDLGSLSPSVILHVLGLSGLTSYFGLRLCEAKSGEVCLVNGAAGAVGSIVGQLAKRKGLIVIGFAGSDEKCQWLTTELNFDYAFNYKKISIDEALKKAAPNGVDVFFDNVGGDFFYEMLSKHMARYGRVCVCGSISNYNDIEKQKYPQINMDILSKELSVRGFYVTTYMKEFEKALDEMIPLVKKGDIKFKETIYDGFETMPEAFIGLFNGCNTGKTIVKASNYP